MTLDPRVEISLREARVSWSPGWCETIGDRAGVVGYPPPGLSGEDFNVSDII